jgi:hypothetical protein
MDTGRRITRWMPAAIALLVVAIPTIASAQIRWGRPDAPRAGACFYRDAGFRGEYFCVRAGERLAWVPRGLNDEISSIRTFGGAEVVGFSGRRFDGRSERFGHDVYNLRREGWNDRLSSVVVRGRGWRDDRRGRYDRYDGRDRRRW